MAQSPAPAGATPGGKHDDLTPMLLEYQSPSVALIEQRVPAASRYTLWVLASMFVVALVLMGTVPIDRVVVTQGKVVTTKSNIAIQPLETSIVRSIDVREGQIVKAGQLLARLDPTFVAADADSLETQVASLQAEVDRLQAEVDGRAYVGDGSTPSQLQSLIFTQRSAERSYRLENYRQRIDAVRVRVDGRPYGLGTLTGDEDALEPPLTRADLSFVVGAEAQLGSTGCAVAKTDAEPFAGEPFLELTRPQDGAVVEEILQIRGRIASDGGPIVIRLLQDGLEVSNRIIDQRCRGAFSATVPVPRTLAGLVEVVVSSPETETAPALEARRVVEIAGA